MSGCSHCGSGKGYDRTYGRCTACGEPYRAGTTGGHFRTKEQPPPEFFERFKGLGKIPIEPALYGTWPTPGVYPPTVELTDSFGNVRVFNLAVWAWPSPISPGVQYRETVDYNSAHLTVYADGSWVADHLDEANPDAGHVLEHAVLDNGAALTVACAVAGFGLGLVTGLFFWRA